MAACLPAAAACAGGARARPRRRRRRRGRRVGCVCGCAGVCVRADSPGPALVPHGALLPRLHQLQGEGPRRAAAQAPDPQPRQRRRRPGRRHRGGRRGRAAAGRAGRDGRDGPDGRRRGGGRAHLLLPAPRLPLRLALHRRAPRPATTPRAALRIETHPRAARARAARILDPLREYLGAAWKEWQGTLEAGDRRRARAEQLALDNPFARQHVRHLPLRVPQQSNSSDCGAFLLTFLEARWRHSARAGARRRSQRLLTYCRLPRPPPLPTPRGATEVRAGAAADAGRERVPAGAGACAAAAAA